jgi:hypothetical protein
VPDAVLEAPLLPPLVPLLLPEGDVPVLWLDVPNTPPNILDGLTLFAAFLAADL